MLSTLHQLAIHQLLALYGHIVDDWQLERLDELYVAEGVFDMSAMGTAPVEGIANIRPFLEGMREKRIAADGPTPLAHLTTNVVLTERGDGDVHAISKTLLIFAGGPGESQRVLTGLYEDIVTESPAGWRIARRTALRPVASR